MDEKELDKAQISRLLTTNQVASWLGVSDRTIRLWAECSEIPASKVGYQWRFSHEKVNLWLKDPSLATMRMYKRNATESSSKRTPPA